jgi:2-keto-myo-inositol isomerase
MRFALNHITAPSLSIEQFFALANDLGLREVEIRNDTPDVVGKLQPSQVGAAAKNAGVSILSINALYPFNVWSHDLETKAQKLADYAAESGARALVMCPLNDGRAVSDDDLVAALERMLPILSARELTGLVEPLGFPISSLRTKRKALDAIARAGGQGIDKLVHDTFHHHLAGESEFFPAETGLVHISGVNDPQVSIDDMLDPHRVLVEMGDRLDNVGQIRALLAAGYAEAFSFEPFSPQVQASTTPRADLTQSIDYIKANL